MHTTAKHTTASIEQWLSLKISELLDIEVHSVDAHAPLSGYGIDSVMALSIVGELEIWLGADLRPDLLGDFATISDLARFLAHLDREVRQ